MGDLLQDIPRVTKRDLQLWLVTFCRSDLPKKHWADPQTGMLRG